MADAVEIWERPRAEEIVMIAGWRQWADAGSISSGLPQYLIDREKARHIGTLHSEGFYLFQIPGTHGLVRPVVKFNQGFPESLEIPRNEFFYAGDDKHGVVIFLGDEPHMNMEQYTEAFLSAARTLGVKRIVSLGGVYGELPYDKERMVSCIYSLRHMREEVEELAVNLSDYHGGASVGSYLCRRAGEQGIEFVGMYGFVPTYDFSLFAQTDKSIRIENDFTAWLGIARRINYMLKTNFVLTDLENKSDQLMQVIEAKVDELDKQQPQLHVRQYMDQLSESYTEVSFNPLGDVWEDEIRRLFDEDE